MQRYEKKNEYLLPLHQSYLRKRLSIKKQIDGDMDDKKYVLLWAETRTTNDGKTTFN